MKEVNVGMCVYINLLEMGNMCESGLVCACERMNERERESWSRVFAYF